MKRPTETIMLVAIALLLLGGCAETSIVTKIIENGKVVKEVITPVANATVKREKSLNGLKESIAQHAADAHKTGVIEVNTRLVKRTVSFDEHTFSWQEMAIDKVVYHGEYKPHVNVPMVLPDHPVWKTTREISKDILTFGIADLTAKVLNKSFDTSNPKYHGDYSYNPQTAEPYIVNPVVIE